MEINLEKIELVQDRTGVSYEEAKEAIEKADGSVVDAIVAIEEKINEEPANPTSFKDSEAYKKIKDLVEKGNISQIKIKKNGVALVNFPVTVGVVGAVLVPWAAVLGAVAALGTHCEVELIDDKGVVLNVSGKAEELYDRAKESEAAVKAKEYVDKGIALGKKGIDKASEYINQDDINAGIQKAKEYAEIAVAKGEELYQLGKEKAEEFGVAEKVEEIKEKITDWTNNIITPEEVEVIEIVDEEETDNADR